MAAKQLVWLITGTSYVTHLHTRRPTWSLTNGTSHRSGFGRELALQVIERGDKVIATARGRSFSKIAELKEKGADTYELDVNAPLDDLHAFARKVVETHGRVDVLLNNAGMLHSCGEEDCIETERGVFA